MRSLARELKNRKRKPLRKSNYTYSTKKRPKRAVCDDLIVVKTAKGKDKINKTGENVIINKELTQSQSSDNPDASTGPINVEDVDIKEMKYYRRFLSILAKSPIYDILSTADKQIIKEIFNCEAMM